MSRSSGERVFLFSWGESIVSSNDGWESLNMKYRPEFKHDCNNHGCLHSAVPVYIKALHGFREKQPTSQGTQKQHEIY